MVQPHRKIYLASSWRNTRQPDVIKALLEAGHQVYDFRHPVPGNHGFHWSEIDPNWQSWAATDFVQGLQHDKAQAGFTLDFDAMQWADTFVLLLPCGKSAHLELGWAVGQAKTTLILLDSTPEPELMYKMADHLCSTLHDVIRILGS